jgi:hypothetical protein
MPNRRVVPKSKFAFEYGRSDSFEVQWREILSELSSENQAQTLLKALREIFIEDHLIYRWIFAANRHLDWQSPRELIREGKYEEVLKVLTL